VTDPSQNPAQDPDQEGQAQDVGTEEDTLEVKSFGKVPESEVELKGPAGSGVSLRGPEGVLRLFRIAAPAAFVLVGLILSGSIILAGRPFKYALAVFGASVLIAALARWMPRPRGG